MNVPGDIKQFRKLRRSELLAQRLAITIDQHRQWSTSVTRLLIAGFPFLHRMTIGLYWPYKGEFDPRFAIREFRKGGAIAALPIVIQKAKPLQFREWWPGVRVTKGVFNLPIPEGTAVLQPNALLIPPVGFDLKGYRLGYGSGYFDRTLANITPQPLKIGVAFELSRIATIYPQCHDIPMDFIVTETTIHYVGPDGLISLRDPKEATQIAEQIIRERDLALHADIPSCSRKGLDLESTSLRQYSSPPCYAHELDPRYWGT